MTHIKTGSDGRGRFAIRYDGYKRINWIREPDCDEYFSRLDQPPPPNPSDSSDLSGLLNAGASALGSVGHVVQGLASILHWWEARQERIYRQIQEETDTRLRLVTDILDRWVLEHSSNDHVDLEFSHYLAREALGLVRLAGESDKVIVPQALLYEFERIRSIVAGVRALLVRQFVTLEGSTVREIASPIEGTPPLAINYTALSRWYGPPEDEWDRAIATRSVSKYEQDLIRLSRTPNEVIKQVFSIEDDGLPDLVSGLSDTARIATSALAGAVAMNAGRFALSTVSPIAGVTILIPLAASLMEKWAEDKRSDNKDAVRELVLFASEVERTRLLLRCWDLLQRVLEGSRGSRIVCLDDNGRSTIAALDDGGRFVRVQGTTLQTRLLPPAVRHSPGSSGLLVPARRKET